MLEDVLAAASPAVECDRDSASNSTCLRLLVNKQMLSLSFSCPAVTVATSAADPGRMMTSSGALPAGHPQICSAGRRQGAVTTIFWLVGGVLEGRLVIGVVVVAIAAACLDRRSRLRD